MTDRVVLVEDHGLIAQTVSAALRANGVDVHVIDAPSTPDLVGAVTAQQPTLALLDLDLGDGHDSLHAIGPLRDAGIPVVMVTGISDPVRRAECIRAGAVGILDKGGSFQELLDGIRLALQQGGLLTAHEREEHLALLRRHESEESERLAPFDDLTPREAEVLHGLIEGRSVDELAQEAFVSIATVRSQVRAILRKLGVTSQLAAVGLARRAGWPSDPR
jgi:two-component system, NarL family, nitrate/nitrite response regulator NarL